MTEITLIKRQSPDSPPPMQFDITMIQIPQCCREHWPNCPHVAKNQDLKKEMSASKTKLNPVFKGLPERLKDIKVYFKIEKMLFDAVQTDHKHKTVKEYVSCLWCNTKREKRSNIIKAEGFKDIGQYLAWKQVMETMTQVDNLKKEHAKTKTI